jgi:hypothetical protein
MDLSTFIVSVFCLTDDWLQEGRRIRQRGPEPTLADSEVLTMEIVGEFLGIDTDEGIYTYFRRHYAKWFPALLRGVHRTTFTRQAANLWVVKRMLCGTAGRISARPGALRPRGVPHRQLSGAHWPLRPGLPLPKVGRGIGLRVR